MESFTLWGLELIRSLQSGAGWLKAPMLLFSSLGREEFYLALLPLIFWCIDKALGKNLVILLIASNIFNGAAKVSFKLPRPSWIEPGLGLSHEDSFGLPSGHAMNATVLWGYLASALGKSWRWLMVAIIPLISISRIFLGVHFPADVLTGWLLGATVLALYLSFAARVAAWLGNRSFSSHVFMAILASGLVLLLFELAIAVPGGSTVVYGVLASTAIASGREGAGTLAGMVLGLWIGLAGEARFVRFSVDGALRQRAGRYLIGIAVVIGLWAGLKAVLPAEPIALGVTMRVLRYAAMLAWTAWVWPWLFVRLGLGRSKSSTGHV